MLATCPYLFADPPFLFADPPFLFADRRWFPRFSALSFALGNRYLLRCKIEPLDLLPVATAGGKRESTGL
jgi:hypothetical protein